MSREKALSGSVESWSWNNGDLEVEFPNGSVYLYHDVPLADWQAMRISPGGGKILRERVVLPGNKYEKLNGPINRK